METASRPPPVWVGRASSPGGDCAGEAAEGAPAEFLRRAPRLAAEEEEAAALEVLAEYWPKAAAEVVEWGSMTATGVGLAEPGTCPVADSAALVAAEASGYRVVVSAVNGPAPVVLSGHWSVRP